MSNVPNSARQAKRRALEVLSETENYVSGVNEDGKKLLYYLIEKLKGAFREVNSAIGEMDNILPQLGNTSSKNEMLELQNLKKYKVSFSCLIRETLSAEQKAKTKMLPYLKAA